MHCHPIIFDQNNDGYKRCGHCYKHINSIHDRTQLVITFENKKDVAQNALHYILLIPNLEEDKQGDYTVVSGEWAYLKDDMALGFCVIQFNCLFTKI